MNRLDDRAREPMRPRQPRKFKLHRGEPRHERMVRTQEPKPARCVVDTSCEPGDHTLTWPCEYAPGTGDLSEVRECVTCHGDGYIAFAGANDGDDRHCADCGGTGEDDHR